MRKNTNSLVVILLEELARVDTPPVSGGSGSGFISVKGSRGAAGNKGQNIFTTMHENGTHGVLWFLLWMVAHLV